MRKHDVRKWLHAILDLLPVIIIPVFMVYSHRHTINDYSVTTGGYEVTEKYQTNEVNDIDDIVANNLYHFDEVDFYCPNNYFEFDLFIVHYSRFNSFGEESIYSDEMSYNSYNSNYGNVLDLHIYYDDSLTNAYFYFTNINTYNLAIIEGDDTTVLHFEDLDFYVSSVDIDSFKSYLSIYWSEFNSITSSDFQSYEYQYNEGLTYNDTDIGSQFMYTMYNTVTKYFNFNQFLNFNDIYTWFVNNIFGGTVPLVVPIVWNIILYEFIMDILFLTYSVFMFIIDFVECALDKAFGKSYRGGR